jgi:hypothetical protein
MLKAQILSYDFMVASLLAVVILLFIFSYFGYTTIQIAESKKINDMMDKLVVASNIWFKEGSPSFWDVCNVVDLGLRKDYYIDTIKTLNFLTFDYKKFLNIVGIPYNVYFRVLNEFNETLSLGGFSGPIGYMAQQYPADVAMVYFLNSSNLTWDFYFGSTTLPAELSNVNARFVYTGERTTVFKWMIANLSAYKVVIAEDPDVRTNDLTESEKEKLREFVKNGGIYFHVQHPEDFLSIFNLTPTQLSTGNGIINDLSEIFYGVCKGSGITFQQATRTFNVSGTKKAMVIAATDESKCLFCEWEYGNGKIYFVPDLNTTSPLGFLPGFNPIGRKLVYGKYPANAKNVLTTKRFGILNETLVNIEVIVWE